MFQNWTKIRRHAQKLAGGKEATPEDVTMWQGRIRKAIVAGKIPAKREGDAGDYITTWKEVERWFRTEFKEVACAFLWGALILSPMLLPGGGV